jgi:hypothetical protein
MAGSLLASARDARAPLFGWLEHLQREAPPVTGNHTHARTWKEHIRFSSTDIIAPALSNSPAFAVLIEPALRAVLTAVVRRAEDCDELSLREELVSILHNLRQ